jgi:hypothetical protein
VFGSFLDPVLGTVPPGVLIVVVEVVLVMVPGRVGLGVLLVILVRVRIMVWTMIPVRVRAGVVVMVEQLVRVMVFGGDL